MNLSAKPESLLGALLPVEELSAQTLLDEIERHTDKPLVFFYDGRDVRPSYHVTEVKTGVFRALDCGANAESWNETFIQLWDIVEESRGHMKAGKFLAIIRKVGEAVGFDRDAKVTFEVSDGIKPMQIYRAKHIEVSDVIRVILSPRPSSCKPRDRWIAENEASCCAPKSEKPCCG